MKVRSFFTYLTAIVLLFFLFGCAGKKVKLLEDQVTQLQARNAEIEQGIDNLEATLLEEQNTSSKLRLEMEAKDQVISEQDDALSDLRFQTLELKAGLEEGTSLNQYDAKHAALTGDFKADYNRAMELFHRRWYVQAAGLYKNLIDSDKQHALADNSQYWLGECYYAQNQFENAIAEFEKVFAFPNSNKTDAAQLKIGLCWLKIGKQGEAREQLIRLISIYPKSEYVARARSILETIP